MTWCSAPSAEHPHGVCFKEREQKTLCESNDDLQELSEQFKQFENGGLVLPTN